MHAVSAPPLRFSDRTPPENRYHEKASATPLPALRAGRLRRRRHVAHRDLDRRPRKGGGGHRDGLRTRSGLHRQTGCRFRLGDRSRPDRRLHLRTGLRDPDARAYRTDRQPACRRSVGALHDGAANRAHAGLCGNGSGVAQPRVRHPESPPSRPPRTRRPTGSRTNATTPPNGSSSRGRSSASTSARATKRTSGSAPSPFTTRRRATTGCNTGR